jgi:hypothetical protein
MAIRPFNSVGGFAIGENPTIVIDANGNITTTKTTLTGNLSANAVLTDNYFYANGSPVDFQQAAGSNTWIQYNLDNDFGASGNFTFQPTTNLLTVGWGAAGEIKTDSLLVTNGINAANLTITQVANIVEANVSGNVTAAYFIGDGSLLTGLITDSISNATSNVQVNETNVTVSANGVANVATFTDTGLTIDNLTTTQDANLNLAPNGTGLVVIANTAGGATGIEMGDPSLGNLISNAVTLTNSSTVSNAIAQLNEILGKLVPPSPPAFPASQTISIQSLSTYRMADFVQTDNTTTAAKNVAGGTTVTSVRRTSSYSTGNITVAGPGDSGIVTTFLNGTGAGARTLTASLDGNGTYSNLVIFNNYDYNSANANINAGFWSVFSTRASGTVTEGWNEVYISHSAAGNTNTSSWYYDASTPGTPTFTSVSITPPASPSYAYTSSVPHYNNTNQFDVTFNVSKLSGDMYPTSDTFVTGTAGGAFGAPASVTYSQAGISTPLARNLYVASGSASISTTATIISGFGSSAGGPSVSVLNSYNTGTQAFIPSANVLYKTGTSGTMEEANVVIGSSIGSGSGLAARIVNPGSSDTPAYTASAALFNGQSSTLETYDATVVGGTLKHDQTNYATGYLPVGPNLSVGRGGAQYFTFRFIRTSTSKFDIKWTGTIAGLWVALPGSGIDTSSTINGWLDLGTAYAGAGQPGAGTGGNGSNGGALGGIAPLNSAQTNKSVTATFGTVSSSGTATNEIYVRIKLAAGQTVSALSLQTASN